MALIINTPIMTQVGIELQTSYARLIVIDGISGDTISIVMSIYNSKESYNSGMSFINALDLETSITVEYNRQLDGTDLLNVGHDVMINHLLTRGIVATKELV